ncbi:hypothetical protein [Frondihabitans sp. PAMC 28766]|nr:hypothetical protein [Frondihabitans sp. PAMC 28766]
MAEDNDTVDGLISRLNVIDGQPLDQRATAFAQIHDELRAALDDPGSTAR